MTSMIDVRGRGLKIRLYSRANVESVAGTKVGTDEIHYARSLVLGSRTKKRDAMQEEQGRRGEERLDTGCAALDVEFDEGT